MYCHAVVASPFVPKACAWAAPANPTTSAATLAATIVCNGAIRENAITTSPSRENRRKDQRYPTTPGSH
jgi:hypothetical protein